VINTVIEANKGNNETTELTLFHNLKSIASAYFALKIKNSTRIEIVPTLRITGIFNFGNWRFKNKVPKVKRPIGNMAKPA
jgi:hypothetical protein